ncbi:hypothetical protein [Desulfoscipio gibsoniae]|uniref:Uncharacterized protein n=1 Tax=Desulfoscipio gibsoniae DSM 7213 TaxID=767817 RepID=R4KHR0_9FIRM|nr:hypothetical protein [Desulfoscipio gibsoniae]AGL02753.1 hypothetical protein Desgi_3410 [Desulfoscipio gibsoniae DSM 7213]
METAFRLKQITGALATVAWNVGDGLIISGPALVTDVRGDAVQLAGILWIPYNSIAAFV